MPKRIVLRKKGKGNAGEYVVRGAASVITLRPTPPRPMTVTGAYKKDVQRLRGDFTRTKAIQARPRGE